MAKQPIELGLLGSSSATGYTFNTNDQDTALGGLVKAEAANGFSVFGIVTNINSSPDATGKALAKASSANASTLVNSAAVNRSLDVSVTTVGYLEGGKLFRLLPPRIPPALSKIILVEGQELEAFTDDGSYINGLMNGNFELPIDAIISTSLYQGFKARGEKKGAAWLAEVVRRLITTFRGDYKTLTRLLTAVGDLLPDNLQDSTDEAQQIGHVIGGDMNLIQARLTVPLGKIQEGSFVVIEDGRMRVYAMLSQLKLGTSSPDFVTGGMAQIPEKVQPLLIGDALYADIEMMPVLMQRDGIASKVTAVKTLPKHFSAVSLANAADIRLIYGDPGDPKNFVIGNTREQGHPICLDMEKFVQRSSGIFGATGTGKSFLTRLILAGLMHFNQASILVLDMHNEYGYDDVASDTGKKVIGLKSKYPDKVKIVGVGAKSLIRGKRPDFNLEIASSDINIEDILLLKEELDLNDTASAVLESLKESFGTGWYRAFQAMTPGKKKIDTSDPKNHKEVMDPSSVEYWARSVGVNQISAVSLRTKIIRLFNKKYINTKPAVNSIAELVRLLQTGHHVVLSFGDYSTDLDYLLICNVLTRLIRHEWEKRSTDYRNGKGPQPRPLVITVEEAHKLLTPTLASQTSFGTIAREMRKFFVTLLVVDQRPSQISTEVMSQLGTRVSGWLGDEDDIHNILTGLPGREALRGMIARLEKKEEVLCMGWGVPVPTPVRTTIYNDEFWKRLLANPMGKVVIPDLPVGEVLNSECAPKDKTQALAGDVEDNESAEDIMSSLGL